MQRVLAVMLVVGLAASCSGDDDSAESAATTAPTTDVTTTEPSPTTEPRSTTPTTEAPTPTTEAPATTTEPPPTTEAPSTTTEPPPTTLDPLADLEASIQRDLTEGNDVLQDVLADPTVPNAIEQLEPYFSGQALEFLTDLIDRYRADDLSVTPSEEVPPSVEVIGSPELLDASEAPTAAVSVCQIDSGILTAPVVDSDLRVPINDDVIRVVAVATVELVDGIWRVRDGGTGREEIGETTCESL